MNYSTKMAIKNQSFVSREARENRKFCYGKQSTAASMHLEQI